MHANIGTYKNLGCQRSLMQAYRPVIVHNEMSAFKKLSLLLACLAASYTADALECDKGYQLLWPLRLNGNQAVELEGVVSDLPNRPCVTSDDWQLIDTG